MHAGVGKGKLLFLRLPATSSREDPGDEVRSSICVHCTVAYMTYHFKFANMAASKLEINFRRLLERCEAMAAEIQDNKENVSWRLEKVGVISEEATV